MNCKRCGKTNPQNAKRCIYCNTPLYNNKRLKVNNGNTSENKKKRTDKLILGTIIALVLILVTIVGIYAFQNFVPKKTGFGGGGGGGGAISATSGQPMQPNNNIEISLDGEDPDVEIYSFNTDTYDILVGETKRVTFTAEIFANIELEEDDVSVIDENGTVLGYMNDNGTDGDSVANDGIYTLVTELCSDVRKAFVYKAKAKNTVSNTVDLFFYTNITAEDYRACKTVISKVSELNDAESIKQFLAGNASIETYTVSPQKDIIKYKMKSGIVCVWEEKNNYSNDIKVKGNEKNTYNFEPLLDYTNVRSRVSQAHLTRVNSKGDVCVVRPFRGSQFTYDDFLDAGNILANILDGNMHRFDDANANLDVFKSFDDYGVILIDSHGTLSNIFNSAWTVVNTDPYLLTGTEFNSIQSLTSADWQAERVVVCSNNDLFGGIFGGGIVAVGGKFFDRYYTDNSLKGSMFYLGTCYSMRNDTIADVLIKKGAEVVYGFSEPVSIQYCNEILQELLINQLVLGMTTARAGFDNSRQVCGNIDPYSDNCQLCIKGNDSFRLVADKERGEIVGSVKDATTGEAIKNALIRIYCDGDLVKSLRTNNSGEYNLNLAVGEYIIKVNYGQYKSAKVSATVTDNITTYIETLLMIDAELNSGYANGTITDATTGEAVDGVNIAFRRSWNNKTGVVIQTTSTNENGYYEISYNPGFYTMEYSKDGYITGYKNIIIGIVDFEAQNAVISPEMPDDGNFRIVLSWSSIPKDLDSHLTGPTVDGGRFHLYYKYANTSNRNSNSDYYQLDLDNTDIISRPDIPETTTIITQLDGVYRYSVHDYTNKGQANSEALSQSNATVNVYKGSALVATYHVPPNVKGSIWTVFELSGNEIKPINKMGNGLENDITLF